jgi:hypothetical protein
MRGNRFSLRRCRSDHPIGTSPLATAHAPPYPYVDCSTSPCIRTATVRQHNTPYITPQHKTSALPFPHASINKNVGIMSDVRRTCRGGSGVVLHCTVRSCLGSGVVGYRGIGVRARERARRNGRCTDASRAQTYPTQRWV